MCWGWRTCGSKCVSSGKAQGHEKKISRSRGHNSALTANLCQSVCVRKATTRTQGTNRSKKVKDDDLRKCYCCRKTCHAKFQCKTRLKDLADEEGKPVTANSRLSRSRIRRGRMRVALLPTGIERVKLISAFPTCETCRMRDTCAVGGRPRRSDQTAQNDTTVATMQSVTAPDDPAHGNVIDSHFGSSKGRKSKDRYGETDVGFLILSAGEASQQNKCFESDKGSQVMLSGPGGQITRICARDPNVARKVCCLLGSTTERTDV